MSEKRRALGRGLAALIPQSSAPQPHDEAATAGGRRDGLMTVPVEEVHPSTHQPRKTFGDERLAELAESIRTQGIIQPLVVRARKQGGFELIAGERRWRAAQRAGLHEVPVVVKDVADSRAFEMALVENLQRQDLNAIEEAEGYQRLVDEFGYTQESLAERVGKERSTVANALRLLRLPASVRGFVIEDRLSMGHARALLGLESEPVMERVARQVVAKAMSVRQVEALVRRERDGGTPPSPPPARPSSANRDLTERLQRALGTKVRVVERGDGRGQLEIEYHSLDQLDGILAKILPG